MIFEENLVIEVEFKGELKFLFGWFYEVGFGFWVDFSDCVFSRELKFFVGLWWIIYLCLKGCDVWFCGYLFVFFFVVGVSD